MRGCTPELGLVAAFRKVDQVYYLIIRCTCSIRSALLSEFIHPRQNGFGRCPSNAFGLTDRSLCGIHAQDTGTDKRFYSRRYTCAPVLDVRGRGLAMLDLSWL